MNILNSVWGTIGKVDNSELVALSVKCCLKKSIESGIGSMRADIIGEIVYTMAAENSQLVGGKVIAKTLKVFCVVYVVNVTFIYSFIVLGPYRHQAHF